MKIENGWLRSEESDATVISHCSSSYFNDRPEPIHLDSLIIHNISLPSGNFNTSCVQDLFLGCLDTVAYPELSELSGLEVSAHLFIRRNGEVLQFVSFDKRAWHAGVSLLEVDGVVRKNFNDFSIGIELEGADTIPYEKRQYLSLIAVTQLLMQQYPIKVASIVGHNEIAPGRKTDPGEAFDWDYYKSAL